MKISKEIKVGLIALIGIGLLYYGMNYLKGVNIFKNQRTFYAVYDSSHGLGTDNSVLLNGIKVGKVTNLEIDPETNASVIVEFYIDNPDVTVPINSVAKIDNSGLIGSAKIVLVRGDASEMAEEGDTLKGDVTLGLTQQLEPLQEKTTKLMTSLDSVTVILQEILDKDARKSLNESIKKINKTFATFETTSLRIDSMIATEQQRVAVILSNVASITTNFRENNGKLDSIIDNFSQISDSVAKADIAGTITKAGEAIENVATLIEKINNGEGSLGMLANDEELYKNIKESALEMDKLIEDIRVNPNRYLHFSVIKFGEKKKPPKKERPKE